MKYLKSFENIYTNKKKEIFNYSSITSNYWYNIIKSAMKFQNINFDLENNDTTNERKTISITKELRKNQPVKNVINAELCIAGGDWEMPVLYFKIELTHQYGLINSDYEKNPKFIWDLSSKDSYKHFVLIPPIEAGNALKQTECGWCAYNNDDNRKDLTKEQKELINISSDDKKLAWKWFEKTIEDVIDERWKMLDA